MNILPVTTAQYPLQILSLQNATLRDNILLGAPFDAQRYHDVVEACALRPDLEMLPAGEKHQLPWVICCVCERCAEACALRPGLEMLPAGKDGSHPQLPTATVTVWDGWLCWRVWWRRVHCDRIWRCCLQVRAACDRCWVVVGVLGCVTDRCC